jgi:hypothetical protein
MGVCQIIQNSEILINEAHSNNYILVLERIPTSFLVSKFKDDVFSNLGPSLDNLGESLDKIKEANQDALNFALYLQNCNLPDLSLGFAEVPTSFATAKVISGKLQFGNLITNIMGDENWFFYRMILYWMYAAHNPEQYGQLNQKDHYDSFYINAHLLILDNHREKVMELELIGMYPQSIGSIDMKYSSPDKIVLPITWTFHYFRPDDKYVLRKV